MSKRSFGLLGLMLAGVLVFVACADPAQPTATPNTSINPTPAGGQPTPTPSSGGNGAAPTPTQAPSGPDPAAGQVAFATNCAACHNIDDQMLVGPGLGGVATKAGNRVPGQSADDYLLNSIKNPGDFLVDGYSPIMPAFPQLSASDLDNLVAYLKTLQ